MKIPYTGECYGGPWDGEWFACDFPTLEGYAVGHIPTAVASEEATAAVPWVRTFQYQWCAVRRGWEYVYPDPE